MRAVANLFGFIVILMLVVLLAMRLVNWINFSMDCTQYLKRAADANTVELAKENLGVAVKYLEGRHLTEGTVSIFLYQPQNDIGFWYSNLRASQEELAKVNANTSQLERSNILMKLRETLTDQSQDGIRITCPKGISIYPYNRWYFYLLVFAGVCCLPFWVFVACRFC
jgi:hypothetical protein